MKKETGIFTLLVVVCLITAWNNPNFLSAQNLANLGESIGQYGVFSIGLGIVIITGGIDLSVGSMCALVGVLLSMLLVQWQCPWPWAVLIVLAVPTLLGWVHGSLVTRFGIQPFIVTLCGMLIYRGLARRIANDTTQGFAAAENIGPLRFLASGRLARVVNPDTGAEVFPGIPMPVIVLILVAGLMWVVLHRSVYGRYLMAVGRNEQAARFSGINTRRVINSAYMIAGLLAGLSGVMFAFYTNSIAPSIHGNFYEVYGIAAAVVGGCSLRGGEGSIVGIVIGTALLQVLQNLVNLLGISSALNFAVIGTVVLVGVLADQVLRNRAKNSRG